MFTVYALSLAGNTDTETQCETLDEALTHLRELITSELAAPDGPQFSSYGIRMD